MSVLRIPISPEDHLSGPADARTTLVEYADYECPYCRDAVGEVKQLREVLGGRLRFVFRNFPLTEIHPDAMQAAEAAEAAGAQGFFWQMHDLLFENQEELGMDALVSYAEALELDLPRFREDLHQHRHLERIHRDVMGGLRSGVNGTPSFFIDGLQHPGSHSFTDLLTAIEGGTPMYGGF